MLPTNNSYQRGLEVSVPGLQTEGLEEKGRDQNQTILEQASHHGKQSSSSTDQAQVAGQLSQGMRLAGEAVSKGKPAGSCMLAPEGKGCTSQGGCKASTHWCCSGSELVLVVTWEQGCYCSAGCWHRWGLVSGRPGGQ